MKLFNAMATIASFTMISRVAGMVRDTLTAGILGAGPTADAFFVALKLPNFFRRVAGEGAFSVSFVPLYSRIDETDGNEAANRFAGQVLSNMLVVLTVFTLAMMAVMPLVIHLIAPGFREGTDRYDLAVLFTRFTFPYLMLMSLTSLFGGVLNAHHKFGPFAAAPILFNLTLIVMLVVGAHAAPTVGHAMALGVSISGLIQLGMLAWFVKRNHIQIRFQRPGLSENTKKLFGLMIPGIISAGVFQINLFVDMMIASLLPEGAISHLYYADRLNQLPLSIAGIAVGTALLPMLARALSAGRIEESRALFNRALEFCFIVAIPAAVALLIIPLPLVTSLFEYGKFSRHDAETTAYVLMGYGIGLPAYIASKVFMTAFWAHQDTKTPVRISIVAAATNIVLCISFMKIFGAPGISLATGLVGWLQVYLLKKQLKGKDALEFDDRLAEVFPKIAVCACIMAVVLAGLNYEFARFYHGALAQKLATLLALIGGGAITYAVAIHASGTLTLKDIQKYLTRKSGTDDETHILGHAAD